MIQSILTRVRTAGAALVFAGVAAGGLSAGAAAVEPGSEEAAPLAKLAGDPANGPRIFRGYCASCHTLATSADGPASRPPLGDLIGRQAGTAPSSSPRRWHGGDHVWTAELLQEVLEPDFRSNADRARELVGTCGVRGLGFRDDQQRADLLAYLLSVQKN